MPFTLLDKLDEDSYLSEFRESLNRIKQVQQAWEEFHRTGDVTRPSVVRPEVLASWKRCRARGLDPYRAADIVRLSPSELEKRIEAHQVLVEVASPFLQVLAEAITDSGFRVDLADKDLFILAQYGKDDMLREAAKFGSGVGTNCCESNRGTSAINLAKNLGRPVQLVGPEHYNINLWYWTCSAVPIFCRENLCGVINFAGHFSLFHKHTFGMAIAVAKLIEQALQQRRLVSELELSNRYLNNVIHAVSDGLVVVDSRNVITTLNQAAGHFLNIDPARAVQRPTDDIFGPNNPFSNVLRSGQSIVNKEVVLRIEGRRRRYFFVGTLEPMIAEEKPQGVLGILKPMASTKGLVKNVIGLKAHFTFDDLIGNSAELREAVRLARQAAELPTTVLLQGESGTGKELFAQAIHNASTFKVGPFVALNCAGIPGELVESELFGYEGGAFTGAHREGRPGKFELAERGTLFLDEISTMPLGVQAKLLRVLQTRTIMRLGGTAEIPVNVRLICATNRDLGQLVQEGTFREDLFYRVNVLAINIPPLRERKEDIPLLVEHFCRKLGQRLGTSVAVEDKAINMLLEYHWPGNVRELENVVERSVVMALARQSDVVQVEDVVSYSAFRDVTRKTPGAAEVSSGPGYALGEIETAAIQDALAVSNGNMSKAARLLGIHRTTLYRKLRKLNRSSV